MIIINVIFVVLFWNMVDLAYQEERFGWATMYMAISAANGVAVFNRFF